MQPYSVLGENIATILILVLGRNIAAILILVLGQNYAASFAVGPNIVKWEQIWQQNSVLGPNMAAILF